MLFQKLVPLVLRKPYSQPIGLMQQREHVAIHRGVRIDIPLALQVRDGCDQFCVEFDLRARGRGLFRLCWQGSTSMQMACKRDRHCVITSPQPLIPLTVRSDAQVATVASIILCSTAPNRLHFHTKYCRQIPHNRIPAIPRIVRGVHLAAGRPKIDSAFIQRVHGHGVAQHIHVAVFLR